MFIRFRIVRFRNTVKAFAETEAKRFVMPPRRGNYVVELHRAVHALGLFLDARTAGAVTQAEALILAHLAEHGTSTINTLHRVFLHRRSTLTSVIDRLEAKGLVGRRPADDDRRSFAVELTRAGRTQARSILRALDELRGTVEPRRKNQELDAHADFLHALAEAAAALARSASD
jgi:DNA-binding MarR family transcriptional regulator